MIMPVLLFGLLVGGGIALWLIQSRLSLPEASADIRKANRAFENELNPTQYFNRSRFDTWSSRYSSLKDAFPSLSSKLYSKISPTKDLKVFHNYLRNGPRIIENHNHFFIEQELRAHKKLFDEKYPPRPL